MSLTRSRIIQYVGILSVLILIAAGYWFFSARASTTLNKTPIGSLTNGLQGYWPMDGDKFVWADTTSEVKDVSGNNRHINLQISGDTPVEVPGRLGQALLFPATATTAGIAPSDFDSYTTGTISMWIKYSGTPGETSTSGTLWGYDDCGSNRGQFQLAMDPQNSEIYLWMVASGASCTATVDARVALPDPTAWHHIVFTDDTSGHKLYIDGVQQTLTYTTGSASTDFFFDNITGTAGDHLVGVVGSENFSGTLDEIRLYNRALSAAEIGSLYRLGTPDSVNVSPTNSLIGNLVGYWTFNGADISGTSAYDRSGSGNNGTLTGGPSPAIGKLGQALDFDGSDDYVSVSDASVLDVGDTADLSLSGWFSRDSFTTDDTLLAKRNGQAAGDTGYILYLDDTTDQLIFEVSDGTDEYSLASTTTFTTAGWHHYAITWDQDSAANSEIFIDGIANSATDTGTIGNIGDLSNALTLRTGAESDDGNPFDGKLDEVRVYNAVLTAEKVKNLYDLGSSDKVNSSASQSQGAGLDSGLAGYWKLDEGSGTSAADASGNGRTGTLNNGVTWTTGRIGGAVDLDGANDYISVTSPPTLGTSYTIAYWAKLDVVASTGVIVGYRSTTAGTPVYFQINADTSSTFVVRSSSGSGEGISTYTNGLSTTGVWYHVTGVRRGNTIQVYINGNPGTADLTSTFGAIAANSLLIGATNVGSSSPSFFFNGQIDEVRLYDRALSEDEITQLYHLSTPTGIDAGLKGYWTFNGADISGTSAYDRSGSGNNGTLTGGPSPAIGKLGQALDFDGSDDYVSVSDASVLDVGDTADLSLSGWFSRDSFTTDDTLLAKRNGQAAGDTGYILYLDDTTDQLIFEVSDGTDEYSLASTTTFTTAGWHHYAITWDQDSAANSEIFIDGIANSATDTGTIGNIGDLSNALTLRTGAESDDGNPFDGKLDEVRVYNDILSADEAFALYNAGR